MEKLIEDLSLIYKYENKVLKLDLKEENLVELCRDLVIDILNTPKYENRDLELNYEDEAIMVKVDKKQLTRAINNLVYNALVHNPEDTKLWMNLNKDSKGRAVIEIQDNGQGMSKIDVDRLFERYYRGTNTGESHKGSGLGMAISKEIMKAHGGSIEVESIEDKGTKFTIIL